MTKIRTAIDPAARYARRAVNPERDYDGMVMEDYEPINEITNGEEIEPRNRAAGQLPVCP